MKACGKYTSPCQVLKVSKAFVTQSYPSIHDKLDLLQSINISKLRTWDSKTEQTNTDSKHH